MKPSATSWKPRTVHCRASCAAGRFVVSVVPHSSQIRSVAVSAKADPRETLSEEQLVEYDACLEFVSTFGLGDDEAETVVQESFGWAGRKYWRKQRVNDPPELSQAQAAVEFLTKTGGLNESQIPQVMKKFPQVLGCSTDQMQYAVDCLQKQWRIKGKALTGTIKNNPNLLGCYIDCYGDCSGDCERCWQRF
eukprot:jgi/Ulvmu1/7864/UM004_0095.1